MDSKYNNVNIIDVIIPEVKDIFLRRYKLLKLINILQPIGRRKLSLKSNVSERKVRNDTDFFKDDGFITYNNEGMKITDEGIKVLEFLDAEVHHFNGFDNVKKDLVELLEIKDVILVESLNYDELTLKNIGSAASKYFLDNLEENDVVGLTGGVTVFDVIDSINAQNIDIKNIKIVPARGSLGRSVKYQANTLVERLAYKIDGIYYPLFTPDLLSEDSIKLLKEEPNIKSTIKIINKINFLIFGIGRADIMAKRRDLDDAMCKKIYDMGAVSEAFGYYFDEKGKIVHEQSTIGISFDTFKSLKKLIAVAGGKNKAQAIASFSKINKNLVLVTDIECAREILGGKK